MDTKQFLKTLINATNHNKFKWEVLPKKHYSTITNIWDGILDAYYINFKEDIRIVVYQYRNQHEFADDDIAYYISICDGNFKFKYEFTPQEIASSGAEMFSFYKLLQRSANNIDHFMSDFVKEFE